MADTYTLADLMEEQRTLGGRPALPDVTPREMRTAPLGQSNLVHRALSSFGQGAVTATQEGMEGRRTPAEVAQTYLTEGPMGPFGSVRVPNPIRAYHGSPHDFEAFDPRHIGSGEGAQAYGHGLYFAEHEGVARSYRDALTDRNTHMLPLRFEGRPVNPVSSTSPAEEIAARFTAQHGDPRLAAEKLRGLYNRVDDLPPPQRDALRLLEDQPERFVGLRFDDPGRMYEVNLHARPEQFLDWDAPIARQPDALRNAEQLRRVAAARHFGHTPEEFANLSPHMQQRLMTNTPAERIPDMLGSFGESGAGIYNWFSAWNKHKPEGAAGALNEAGIPGIRYLDQGSRGMAGWSSRAEASGPNRGLFQASAVRNGAREEHYFPTEREARAWADAQNTTATNATSNYVVFNPEIIEILRKYGIIAPPVGAGAAASLNGEPQP